MKILVENSGYALANMGDVAMLQSGVRRIRRILPDSDLAVITTAPERLEKFCPGCRAVSAADFSHWQSLKVLPLPHRLFGGRAREPLRNLDARIRYHFPSLAISMIRRNARAVNYEVPGLDVFWNELLTSDAVIGTGGGYFTDSFPFHAEGIADRLRLGQQFGKPTALFSQGLGPLTHLRLRNKLAGILPQMELICLRESRKGIDFLKAYGVGAGKTIVTGDDAVDLARENTPLAPGSALGFNVRIASYSGVSGAGVEALENLVRKLAGDLEAPVIAIPIETKPEDSDVLALQKVIPSGLCANPDFTPGEPVDVVRQVAKCRLVITGSYHAGVFALAMGIPVIGLIKSEYYADKFLGLQAQFETGMEVVYLGKPDTETVLQELAKRMWAKAPEFRDELLRRADAQIGAGLLAYQKFFKQFSERKDSETLKA